MSLDSKDATSISENLNFDISELISSCFHEKPISNFHKYYIQSQGALFVLFCFVDLFFRQNNLIGKKIR